MNLVQKYICNCEHAITNIINAITYEKNKLERFTKNKEELNEVSNCYKYTAMIKWLTNGKIIIEEVSNYINNSILCKFGEMEVDNSIEKLKIIIETTYFSREILAGAVLEIMKQALLYQYHSVKDIPEMESNGIDITKVIILGRNHSIHFDNLDKKNKKFDEIFNSLYKCF